MCTGLVADKPSQSERARRRRLLAMSRCSSSFMVSLGISSAGKGGPARFAVPSCEALGIGAPCGLLRSEATSESSLCEGCCCSVSNVRSSPGDRACLSCLPRCSRLWVGCLCLAEPVSFLAMPTFGASSSPNAAGCGGLLERGDFCRADRALAKWAFCFCTTALFLPGANLRLTPPVQSMSPAGTCHRSALGWLAGAQEVC